VKHILLKNQTKFHLKGKYDIIAVMPRVISEKDIPDLLTSLKKTYTVFAPIAKNGELIYGEIADPTKVVLTHGTTLLPPKIYFLPANEELFKVTGGKVQEEKSKKPFVVFGLNIKDLFAIVQLDQIMSKKPADTFYLKNRETSTLVAIAENCVENPPGGDLILEKVAGNEYQATILSEKGRKIANLPVFKEKKVSLKKPSPETRTKLDQMLLDGELLARAVEWSRENYPEIWERLGKTCLACGICTYVCPLCYCTSTEDKISVDSSVCSRCRVWDACTLPGFAQVASGHNFRPTQKDRYFNWFYHKFVRGYKETGQVLCVACHRCQKYCPAHIDIEKVLDEVVEKFQKAHPERKF